MNPESKAYLRELSNEFDVSSNAVRVELKQFTKSGLINSEKDGRKILYKANKNHPLFPELSSMTKKVMGIDKVIESIITRLGKLELAYLLDDYAIGRDSGIIDILLIGNIDNFHLNDLTKKTERYLNRKIRYLVLEKNELKKFKDKLEQRPNLLIWQAPEK